MNRGSAQPTRNRAVDRELEDESVFDWLRRQARAERKPIPPPGITQSAPQKKAPAAGGHQREGKNQNPNHFEGEPA